jgi:hypothetical protein
MGGKGEIIPFNQALPNAIPEHLETVEYSIALFFFVHFPASVHTYCPYTSLKAAISFP